MFQADPFVLARIQFATNMTFHILFPTISIGLGWVLLFFKTRFTATGQHQVLLQPNHPSNYIHHYHPK